MSSLRRSFFSAMGSMWVPAVSLIASTFSSPIPMPFSSEDIDAVCEDSRHQQGRMRCIFIHRHLMAEMENEMQAQQSVQSPSCPIPDFCPGQTFPAKLG